MPDGIQRIYAIADNHYLLQDNKPKVIGRTYHSKRYLPGDYICLQDVVEFHFGDSRISDLFFFEDGLLKFHSISLYTESFITDCYIDVIESKKTSPEALISLIAEKYTLKQMGF